MSVTWQRRADLVPWAVFAVLLSVLAIIEIRLTHREEDAARAGLEHHAQQLARRIELFAGSRLQLIEHIRRQFELGLIRSREDFVAVSSGLQDQFVGFQALNWIDQDGVIRWVVPLEPNRPAVGMDIRRHEQARPALERALAADKLVATAPIELAQGGRGFACYLPVQIGGELGGFLNGVFRFDRFFDACFGSDWTRPVSLAIRDGDTIATLGAPPARTDLSARSRIAIDDREWTLEAYPDEAFLRARSPASRRLLTALGALLSFVLALLTKVARTRRAQLAASERAYRQIVDTAMEGVWLLDRDGRTTFVNQRLAVLLGRDPPAILGRPAAEFLTAESMAALARALEEEQDQGDALDVTLLRPGGQPVAALAAVRPIREQGEPAGALIMVSDVTDRRRLEEELRHAQKMEAVGRLAGGVAHDFNNLLVVILGAGDLLREHVSHNPAATRLIDEIVSAGERGAGLTRQLLAFSRREVLRPTRVDVAEVIARLEPMLRRVIGEDVTLEVRVQHDPRPAVFMDATQLEQVILNLVVNAREAMHGGGRIEIAGRVEDDVVVLEVSDDGPGVPEELRERVFEPFFTTKPSGVGTGLGLSTVGTIVRQAGGEVRIDRSRYGGALVRVKLPSDRSEPDGVEDGLAGEVRAEGEAVLLVEDERAVRDVLEETLRRAGYRVVSAGSCARARAILEERGDEISLLLTDVVMPGESGVDLAHEFAERFPGARVVLMSGYLDKPRTRDPLPGPVIRKPFSVRELLAAAREPARAPGENG